MKSEFENLVHYRNMHIVLSLWKTFKYFHCCNPMVSTIVGHISKKVIHNKGSIRSCAKLSIPQTCNNTRIGDAFHDNPLKIILY